MYVSIGPNAVARTDEIIGIFDMDNCTWSSRTRKSLLVCEKENRVISVGDDLPRAIVVCSAVKKERRRCRRKHQSAKNSVYLTQLSVQTLERRAESGQI